MFSKILILVISGLLLISLIPEAPTTKSICTGGLSDEAERHSNDVWLASCYSAWARETSEPPIIQWNKTYGGTSGDLAWSVVQTNDGGYAIAGYTYSFGTGNANFWLVKTDSSGNAQWNKTYAGSESCARSVIQTIDGGYAIAGYTYTLAENPNYNFWLVKADSDGNMQWNKTYGWGNGTEKAYSVVQTIDGGYAIVGDTFSFCREPWHYYIGVLLVKINPSGDVQWNKTYGEIFEGGHGEPIYKARSLIQTIDGGYAIAGRIRSYGTTSEDFWLIKTDLFGNQKWNRTYGGMNDDGARCVIQTIDGGYAIAGCTQSYGYGNGDFWLVKADSDGNMQWNKTYGGMGWDYAWSVINTGNGGYILAGGTQPFGGKYEDCWLVMADSLGTKQWTLTYGGPKQDGAYSIVQTIDGGYAIAGITQSFGAGYWDFWLVKIGFETYKFLSVPYQNQDDTSWCGPTSLAMVLNYYGYNVHSWDIAKDLDLEKDESVFLGPGHLIRKNLLDYLDDKYHELPVKLEKYSERSEKILVDIQENINNLYPVIVALKHDGSLHAAVATGFNNTGFFFNDPSGSLSTWTGRPYKGVHDIRFFVSSYELLDFLYVPSLPDTGTLLVIQAQPLYSKGMLYLFSGNKESGCGSIYARHGDTKRQSFVYLDGGMIWRSIESHSFLDEEDTLFAVIYFSNSMSISQKLTLVLRIIGEDSIVYYENASWCEEVSPYSWSYNNEVIKIHLKHHLNKSQNYQFYFELLDAIGNQIDYFSTPQIYYVCTKTTIHNVNVNDETYPIYVTSNSAISDFAFMAENNAITFKLSGLENTTGFCNIAIPDNFLWGDFSVYLDDDLLFLGSDYTLNYNGTQFIFQIWCEHSIHQIRIVGEYAIPEFTSFLILPLFMTLSIIAVVFAKKKVLKKPKT